MHVATELGGCGGYVLVKLNTAINCNVEMVCPKCGHKHRRSIVNGEIKEEGRFNGSPAEEIYPTIGAWSEKPHTKEMVTVADTRKERDGVVIKDIGDLVDDPDPRAALILRQSWIERFAGKLLGG